MPEPANIQRQLIHKGAKFDFEELAWIGREGKTIRRQVVRHPGAVIILPILPGGDLLLIRSFRPATGQSLLEFPAGTLEPPEPPETCAGRELVEETGYRAASLRPLGRFYTSPGLSDELMHAFVATDLSHVGQDLQEDEELEVITLSPARALDAIDSGELLDAKSILILLRAAREGLIRS
jgi:ADP-ribose pyrophosphatase